MSTEFENGFIAGQLGKPVPPKASKEWLEAYGRGYETSDRESAIAEYNALALDKLFNVLNGSK